MSIALQDHLSVNEVQTWHKQFCSELPVWVRQRRSASDTFVPVTPYDGLEFCNLYVQIIAEYLQTQDDPKLTATQLGDLVESASDIVLAHYDLQMLLLNAVFQLSNSRASLLLADLTNALVSLPEPVNRGNSVLLLRPEVGTGRQFRIKPGEIITDREGLRLWSDLRDWGMQMTEACEGGRESISYGLSAQDVHNRWLNVNTYCAYLVDRHSDKDIFRSLHMFVLRTMIYALETKTRRPRQTEWYVPAACRMIQILGHKIYRLSHEEPQFDIEMASDVIREEAEFTVQRWFLWKRRFESFAQTNDVEIIINAAMVGLRLMNKIDSSY